MHAFDKLRIDTQVVLEDIVSIIVYYFLTIRFLLNHCFINFQMDQAKVLLSQDEKFKKGWKFDHVWNIIKNFEKF